MTTFRWRKKGNHFDVRYILFCFTTSILGDDIDARTLIVFYTELISITTNLVVLAPVGISIRYFALSLRFLIGFGYIQNVCTSFTFLMYSYADAFFNCSIGFANKTSQIFSFIIVITAVSFACHFIQADDDFVFFFFYFFMPLIQRRKLSFHSR